MSLKTLHLIDASPYIFRAYYSLPATIVDSAGRPANAIYGFAVFLCQLLEQIEPGYLAVAFDQSLTTSFRNEIYPDYKAQRELPPAELEAQMQACMELARAMGLAVYVSDRYEADDLIGTLAHQVREKGFRLVIVSNDKDLAQLIEEGDIFWDFARDRRWDVQGIFQHFGVYPRQIVDMLALMGDKVDNIPGVPGVGKQTAVALLSRFGSVEQIFQRLHEIPGAEIRSATRVHHLLKQHQQSVFLSQRLARISTEAPIQWEEENLAWKGLDRQRVDALFDRLNFGTGIRERIKALEKRCGNR